MFGASASASTSTSSTNASGQESSQQKTQRLGTQEREELKAILTKFGLSATTEDEGFSKAAAIKDSTALINSIFDEYRQTELPQIVGAMTSGGGYSSTGAQLLSNDAYARTTNKAAQTVLGNIASYADIAEKKKQTAVSGFNSAINALLGAEESTNASSSFATKSKTKTTSVSAKVGF